MILFIGNQIEKSVLICVICGETDSFLNSLGTGKAVTYDPYHPFREFGQLFGRNDKRRHYIDQFAKRTEPDAFIHKTALQVCHIHRFFHLDHSDGTQYTDVRYLRELTCRS